MDRLICYLFGHKRIVRDWYPTDPITKICCRRCGITLEQHQNPNYNPQQNQNQQYNDWNQNQNF